MNVKSAAAAIAETTLRSHPEPPLHLPPMYTPVQVTPYLLRSVFASFAENALALSTPRWTFTVTPWDSSEMDSSSAALEHPTASAAGTMRERRARTQERSIVFMLGARATVVPSPEAQKSGP